MNRSPLYMLIAILVGAIGILSVAGQTPSLPEQSVSVVTQRGSVAGVSQGIATIMVDEGNGTTYSFDQIIDTNTTALDILQIAMQKNFITVSTKKYDFGIIVESIDGVANGTDNKYWIYTVNDNAPPVGADQFVIEGGDTVTWQFTEALSQP